MDLLESKELSQAETEVYGMFTLNSRSNHSIEVTVAPDRVGTTLQLDKKEPLTTFAMHSDSYIVAAF